MRETPMLADETAARLDSQVALLHGRVKSALELSELIARKELPQSAAAAFVLDNGMSGRAAESSEGAFLQDAEEMVSVVLVLRSAGQDAAGSKVAPTLHQLKWDVIFSLCGWGPAAVGEEDETGIEPIGVLELRRGRVNSVLAGTVFYQLDFAVAQQIRVIS
jgi:hypothetical protein